jgi:hypothetical protein
MAPIICQEVEISSSDVGCPKHDVCVGTNLNAGFTRAMLFQVRQVCLLDLFESLQSTAVKAGLRLVAEVVP